ncbi:hypothetical protein FHT86_000927 [Rhizobium sp. BK313]|nr:DUF72 domain-containing protein [Rhizobium sp. BK313]MBB3452671.1 hypothetical protein [Rhizobium sp. BK313]
MKEPHIGLFLPSGLARRYFKMVAWKGKLSDRTIAPRSPVYLVGEADVKESSWEEIEKRRLRRAERRQNQRIANLNRAEKMHVARMASERDAEPAAPEHRMSGATHIGCSGWFYWHWKGEFYPADVPSSFLFQLPPSVRYDPDRLQLILTQLDPRHRNVVEFRGKSWWNEETLSAFRGFRILFLQRSPPSRPVSKNCR